MKKIVSICLVLILLVGVLSVGVYAASSSGNEIMPYYVVITSWSATLNKTSSTTAGCHVRFSTEGDQTIVATMYLKRQEGTIWETEASWPGQGTATLSLVGDSSVKKGYNYKVYGVADIYDSDGNFIERATASSNTVSY